MPTFLVLLVAYTLSQFYRSFLAVIAPELAAELELSPADLGLLSSTWFAVFAISQIPVGAALDWFGPRRTVAVGMLAAVAGSLLWSVAASGTHVIVGMGLIGVGCAPIYMGALYVFGRSFDPRRFALLSSWMLAIGSTGNLASSTPLAWAAAQFGWRGAFLAVALLTLGSAALVLAVVRDPPKVESKSPAAGLVAGLVQVLSIRALWPLLPLVAVSYAVVIAERGLWIGPFLAATHGLDGLARGNAVLAVAAVMIIGAFIYGPLDSLLGTRKWIVVAGAVLSAGAFSLLAAVPGLTLGPTIALLAVALAAGSTYAVLMAHGRAFLPEALLGRGITLINLVFMAGASLVQVGSGYAVGHLAASGASPAETYAALHTSFAALIAIAALIYLRSTDAPPPRTAVTA